MVLSQFQWAIAGVLSLSSWVVAVDHFGHIDYTDLGISLVIESQCEETKESAKYYGGPEMWADLLRDACNEPTTKLSPADYAEEQKELRKLRDDRDRLSETTWNLSRAVVDGEMRMRRIRRFDTAPKP